MYPCYSDLSYINKVVFWLFIKKKNEMEEIVPQLVNLILINIIMMKQKININTGLLIDAIFLS